MSKSLGEVITLKRGYDLPNRVRIKGEVPVVSSSGITDFHSVAKLNGEGVITGRYGTLGEVFYVNGEYWPLNTTLYVSDFKSNEPKFIFYFLKVLGLQNYNGAAAVPGLDRNVLHKIECKFPSDINTQRRIAAILSAYDDLIENNLKRIKLLEEAAQNIYKEWFVHFRFPGHEQTRMGENGIPEGWEYKTYNDACTFINGYAFRSESYSINSRYKIVTIKNVGNRIFLIDRLSTINTIPENLKNECHITEGDILLSLTGNIGRTCLAYGKNLLLNQRVAIVKPHNKNLYSYLYFNFGENTTRHMLNSLAIGVAQQNLSTNKLLEQYLIIPSIDVLSKYNIYCNNIIHKIINLYNQNLILIEARDLLLPRLMNETIQI